ncbi:hypothetical protein [Streptomyces sp. NPDC093225]|uniref:DUF7144 family membrane protein n=1 Tax=Streptomyces sp. NPDC093225 TaxID=3366034 RepID=UPI0038032264
MATQSARTSGGGAQGWTAVSGWTLFAGTMMIFGGVMAAFEGIAAIAKDDVFVSTWNFTFQWSLTGWGWLHLILGIVVVLAGLAVFNGATWARVVGIALVGLSMLANFAWLPWYPFWAILLIAIDGFVIWALCIGPSRDREALRT